MTPVERVLARSTVAASGCLEWTGCLNSKGYGVISVAGARMLTHRVAYEAAHGPIAEGMTVDHICHNRRCVNGAHLRTLTRSANSADQPNANKSHCIHGHELTVENTLVKKRRNGGTIRNCRTCANAQQKARAWARKWLDRELTDGELAEFCKDAA